MERGGGGSGHRGRGRSGNSGGFGGGRQGGYGGGRGSHQPELSRSRPYGDRHLGVPEVRPGDSTTRGGCNGGRGRGRGRGGERGRDGGGGGGGDGAEAGGSGGPPVRLRNSPVPVTNTAALDTRKIPIRRPDRGGTISVRPSRLCVNHFSVDFNPDSMIMHYNVDVLPEMPPKNGRPTRISKSDLSMVREKLFPDDPAVRLPMTKTAYDGDKNIFSAVSLPEESFRVVISRGDDEKSISYVVTLTLVNKLKLRKLRDYLTRHNLPIPRDILQGMDLVVKENPSRRTISVGRGFYSTKAVQDLQPGILAIKGFQQSLKPTSQGLSLCVDYTVLAFRKKMSVLDFLHEMNRNFRLNEFGKYRKYVEKTLIGLKVNVTHRRTKQRYTISKLTPRNTKYITFPVENPNGGPPKIVSLLSYFKEKYGIDIVHKDIPCLDLGKSDRMNYVPMEFCILVEGQRYPREDLTRNGSDMLRKMSLADPKYRARMIRQMVRSDDGPCGGGVTQQFGMNVNLNMTTVTGRVIGPPALRLGSPKGEVISISLDPETCVWNLNGRSMVVGKSVERWGILDFTCGTEDGVRLEVEEFIRKLTGKYKMLGIPMKRPIFYEPSSMKVISRMDLLHDLLERINEKVRRSGQGQLQFLVCVMTRKVPGYKYLKWISETKVGIVTQCCLSNNANVGKDQYLTNLSLKINAKLGGSNVELINRLPHFDGEDHVMFVGADVNHPGARDTSSPSIAAVVASTNWPAANRYAARVCPQFHRTEKILSFGDMCLELVECYHGLNKVRPEKIVIFRDGVSEGQFDMVLNEELLDLKRVFQGLNYFPTITLIVAQKRHNTRLFPQSQKDGASKGGNVFAGTVVDTKITHPFEFDFYLCSHHGTLGTSKPTHYHVLWDEHKFTSDELQQLIYEMCFTFARCTKPVSLVPPVFYADLAAYRGRLYHEVVDEMQSPVSAASSSSSSLASSSLSSIPPTSEQKFYRLHADLENKMFFI